MIQGLWVPFYTLHIFLTPQRSVEGRDVDSNVLDRVPVLDVILLRRDFDVFQLGYGQLSTVCVFSSFFIFYDFCLIQFLTSPDSSRKEWASLQRDTLHRLQSVSRDPRLSHPRTCR